MGEVRISKENREVLQKLSKTHDLRGALEIMANLQNRTYMEEKVVAEYDERTGKPTKNTWKPYKTFGTDFTFGGESYSGDINVKLTKEVIADIKKGPVCFDKDGKRYVAKFETKDHSSLEVHCIEHLIYVSEVRNL